MLQRGYPTPEQAALAEWRPHPQAQPRVVEVKYTGEHKAIVMTDTDPSHPMWSHCVRTDEGWVLTHDHN